MPVTVLSVPWRLLRCERPVLGRPHLRRLRGWLRRRRHLLPWSDTLATRQGKTKTMGLNSPDSTPASSTVSRDYSRHHQARDGPQQRAFGHVPRLRLPVVGRLLRLRQPRHRQRAHRHLGEHLRQRRTKPVLQPAVLLPRVHRHDRQPVRLPRVQHWLQCTPKTLDHKAMVTLPTALTENRCAPNLAAFLAHFPLLAFFFPVAGDGDAALLRHLHAHCDQRSQLVLRVLWPEHALPRYRGGQCRRLVR